MGPRKLVVIVIDVREPQEFNSGHVKGALNIPLEQIMSNPTALANIPKDERLVLYCQTGNRSEVAINMLKSMGFTNLVNGINKDHVEAEFLLGN